MGGDNSIYIIVFWLIYRRVKENLYEDLDYSLFCLVSEDFYDMSKWL